MTSTLLQICQNVAEELGTAVPSSIIGNQDSVAVRLKRLVTRAGQRLAADEHKWNALEIGYTFATVNGQPEYDLPADFGRPSFRTNWNRTTRWRLTGPLSSEQWGYIKARPFASTIHSRYRILRSATSPALKFTLDPTPTVNDETIAFMYYSNGWCMKADGTPQTEMLLDTDLPVLREDLIELSLRWRYAAALQRASALFVSEFERAVDIAKADDLGGQRLRTGLDDRPRLPGVEGVILQVPWDDMTGATWESWGVGSS